MKITKYLHSCLLIEENNKSILIDPGIFTNQDNVLDISSILNLDFILITHIHPDHFSIDLIKKILIKFPEATILTNESVSNELFKAGIKSMTTGNDQIRFEDLEHEKLWDIKSPQNTVFTIFNKLTHPGDSLSLVKTADILALPITAPWGSVTNAVDVAMRLKPKAIIPIHDWHWKDEVRKTMYERLSKFFSDKNIVFYEIETGISIEIV